MDVPGEGVRLSHDKSRRNQDQMDKSLLRKEIIRSALSTPRKAHSESRYGLRMWKHLQG